MVRLGAARIPLFDRTGNFFADRTFPGALVVLPCQTILLTGRANDALGVLVYVVTLMGLKSVFMLGLHVTVANLNGVQFIRADAAVEEFLAACFGVKRPFVTLLHERHGERPILIADEEERAIPALRIHGHVLLLVGLSNKIRGVLPVLREFAAEHDVFAARSKNVSELDHIKLLGRVD